MTNHDHQRVVPVPNTNDNEPNRKNQNGRHASTLLQDTLSTYLVRAWYEFHGSPYGDSELGLLRWTQEQLDKMHSD